MLKEKIAVFYFEGIQLKQSYFYHAPQNLMSLEWFLKRQTTRRVTGK